MSALTAVLRRSTALSARLIGNRRTTQCLPPSFSAARNVFSGTSTRKLSSSTWASIMRPSSDESLIRTIDSEIRCAEESVQTQIQMVPEGFPFEIEDNPGKQTVSLSRDYMGETIHVVAETSSLDLNEMDDSEDEDDDTEEDHRPSLPLVVRISKKDGFALEFFVTAFSNEITIDSIFIKDPQFSDDNLAYEGPILETLDENLQKCLLNYLEVRGIKPTMANFLHEYLSNKENREYTNWLKILKKFLES